MVWAPSSVWDEATSQFYVFWASRFFDISDSGHTGKATLNRIRYATTRDFTNFSPAKDYINLPDVPLIDQEFQYLGIPGHFARFLKNERTKKVYQEVTTTGLFGQWTRNPGYVTDGNPREGPASFADNLKPDVYHLLLDDYTQYIPYETANIKKADWKFSNYTRFPRGLKHGSVTPLLQSEYNIVTTRFPTLE
jgi:hypothetical protein